MGAAGIEGLDCLLTYLLHRSPSLFASTYVFAQATSLNTAIGGGMGILADIAYLGAFAMITM
jgi:hypothetical protein